MRFLETSNAPHLPFTDALFDQAYCGSVFSHIPDQADAWLCEFARVIKPGGSLYATFLPIDAMHRYLKDHPTFGFSSEVARAFDADTLEQADFDLLVCERSPVAHVVYREEVFIAMCEQAFEVVSLTPNSYTFQSAVLLRRR